MGFMSKIVNFFYKTPFTRQMNWVVSNFSFLNKDLATNETIYSAVSMLANGVASAPVTVTQDYKRFKPAENKLAELFEFGPNPFMTMFEFVRTLETLRDTYGAGYAIKEYSANGKLKYLYVLKPHTCTPVRDKDSQEIYYRVSDDDGDTVFIHCSEIIAVHHLTTDGYTPISPMDVLRNTIQYDTSIKEFSLNQMTNGLKPNIVVSVKGKLNRENLEMYQEMMKQFKKNGVLFLDAGKEVTDLKNATYVDPSIAAVEKITVERVERCFNMHGKLSGAATDGEDLLYLKDCLLPIIRMYEQEFTKKLVSRPDRMRGIKVKFNMNGYARANMKDRANFYQFMIRNGVFNPNEIRALEDLPPYDGGDQYFVSRDICPIEQIYDLINSAGGTSTPTETETTGSSRKQLDTSKGGEKTDE